MSAAAPTDATLVTAALAGDRQAFADIYDRYAPRMHDFCWSLLRSHDAAADAMQDTFVIAADRLAQLRDPDRLRPWLYAVARSVALRQLRGRQREQVAPELDATPDPGDGPHDAARRAEIRDLLWDAARGLSERDRVVLDLHLRHGLEGRDLAQALGVTENGAAVMLSRVRDRVERSLGAFLIARHGAEDCEELGRILHGWDGRFTPLVRKRVARHVDACEVCGHRRAVAVSPWQLLGTVPFVALPSELRDRVLGRIERTSATRHTRAGRAARVAAVAVAVAVVTGGVVAGARALRSPQDAATPPAVAAPAPSASPSAPSAPALVLTPARLDLAPGDAGRIELRNDAGRAVTWSAEASVGWLALSADGGRLPAGGTRWIDVRVRAAAPPDPPRAAVVVSDGTDASTVAVRVLPPDGLPRCPCRRWSTTLMWARCPRARAAPRPGRWRASPADRCRAPIRARVRMIRPTGAIPAADASRPMTSRPTARSPTRVGPPPTTSPSTSRSRSRTRGTRSAVTRGRPSCRSTAHPAAEARRRPTAGAVGRRFGGHVSLAYTIVLSR